MMTTQSLPNSGVFNLTENFVSNPVSRKNKDSDGEEEEEGFDAFYIKRLMGVLKEKNMTLNTAYE